MCNNNKTISSYRKKNRLPHSYTAALMKIIRASQLSSTKPYLKPRPSPICTVKVFLHFLG